MCFVQILAIDRWQFHCRRHTTRVNRARTGRGKWCVEPRSHSHKAARAGDCGALDAGRGGVEDIVGGQGNANTSTGCGNGNRTCDADDARLIRSRDNDVATRHNLGNGGAGIADFRKDFIADEVDGKRPGHSRGIGGT